MITRLSAYLKSLFARPAPAPRPTDPNAATFGYVDTKDGTFYPGYITPDGEMAFQKTGVKGDVWDKPKYYERGWYNYIGAQPHAYFAIWSERNRFTNEVRYFKEVRGRRIYFDTDALTKGHLYERPVSS